MIEMLIMTKAKVWARDYQGDEKWSPGIVTKQTGPVSYEMNVRGQTWSRHAEQLRPAEETVTEQAERRSAETEQHARPKRNIKEPERLTYEQLGKPN